MSTEKPKADGYVAWHPEHGADIYTASAISEEFPRSNLMNKIFKLSDRDTPYDEMIDSSYWELWKKLQEDGWRIRPVKLVFLDEEEK